MKKAKNSQGFGKAMKIENLYAKKTYRKPRRQGEQRIVKILWKKPRSGHTELEAMKSVLEGIESGFYFISFHKRGINTFWENVWETQNTQEYSHSRFLTSNDKEVPSMTTSNTVIVVTRY